MSTHGYNVVNRVNPIREIYNVIRQSHQLGCNGYIRLEPLLSMIAGSVLEHETQFEHVAELIIYLASGLLLPGLAWPILFQVVLNSQGLSRQILWALT